MLVAGSVIIGMREETDKQDAVPAVTEAPASDNVRKATGSKESVGMRGTRNRAGFRTKKGDASK